MIDSINELNNSWDEFVKVYNRTSPIINSRMKKLYPAGEWVLRIDDSNRTLLLQDIHPMPSHRNFTLDELKHLNENQQAKEKQ